MWYVSNFAPKHVNNDPLITSLSSFHVSTTDGVRRLQRCCCACPEYEDSGLPKFRKKTTKYLKCYRSAMLWYLLFSMSFSECFSSFIGLHHPS